MREVRSLRVAYGQILVRLGKEDERIVVLEADLSKSTMGSLFGQAYPERFYEMGIAEANMASVAGGLSLTGLVPFMASFAVFSTGRCYDQIRTSICIAGLNVKICGSSAGLSDYGDGSSHQSVEDIATMRALPNMSVFCPADAVQVERIVTYMAQNDGPMYLRICRSDLPVITDPDWEFVPGRIYPLTRGADVAIFATGAMVAKALEAAEQLRGAGIDATVVNVPSIKPLNADEVVDVASGHRAIITAEEHSTIGGLGDAIASCVSPVLQVPILRVGVNDRFGTSAENYEVLMEDYGLTAKHIADCAMGAIGKP